MAKPKGQEMVAIERTVCYSSQEEGTHHAMDPNGEAPGLVRRLRGKGNVGRRLYCGFHGKEEVKQSSRSRFGWFE